METKELKITIPEGFEIDKDNSTFEKIVFKKKDTKPRSWEEYCKLKKENLESGYVIDDGDSHIATVGWKFLEDTQDISSWRNVLHSKELAEAFLAMMQLMSLRQAWIGDWQPMLNGKIYNYCIIVYKNKYIVDNLSIRHPLSFPTKEMAEDFMNTFKDLLNVARPLI